MDDELLLLLLLLLFLLFVFVSQRRSSYFHILVDLSQHELIYIHILWYIAEFMPLDISQCVNIDLHLLYTINHIEYRMLF